jgi:hypothetical protein
MFLLPQSQGWISDSSRPYSVPLPPHSTLLTSRANYSAYLAWGQPDLERLFSARAQAHGWTYVERFGPVYILTSEGRRVTVLAEHCNPFLTAVTYILHER